MKSIEAHTKLLELDDHGARKIDGIVRKLYIQYIHSFHTEQAPTSPLPSHDPTTTTEPRRAPCPHRLFRQRRRRRRRPGHIVPPQLMDTVLVLAQLRHRPLPRQLLRAVRPRLPPLVAPALPLREAPQRRRHRPLRFQPPLLPDQQRDARHQERPERYPDAEAHGQGVGARRRGRRRRRGGGRGRAPGGHGHGRRRGGGGGGGGGVGEPDAVGLGARELGVAQEEAEVGEGEVGGAGAGAFAFPDAGGGAGEDVHGCVALSWGGECQLLLKEEGRRGGGCGTFGTLLGAVWALP